RPARCRSEHDRAEIFVLPRKCSAACESVTEATETEKKKSLFTRTLHGGLNIITNICLQPIAIFIGRYYKETFNQWNWKGQKLWYWVSGTSKLNQKNITISNQA